jgi:signal transduction histidine kinase
MHSESAIFDRYQELQAYVGWTADDERRIVAARPLVTPEFLSLVEDFYAAIVRHEGASRAITGGAPQIERLKQTLVRWLGELFTGPYDQQYVARRWKVGLRHVEIGLSQVYTAAAMSRLRNGLNETLRRRWRGSDQDLALTLQAVHKLLDLDLAVISDAYETDYVQRQQAVERRRLGEVLHREQELSAGLLNHAQVAIVVLDQRGLIVRANALADSLATQCGVGPASGCDWVELFLRPENRGPAREALAERSRNATLGPLILSSTLELGGGRRHLHWSAAPLLDAAGQPFAVLAIGQDVTDLYEAQQQALQAQRLAAIGQMATGLAHESRNALQRIGASAEMLELELEHNSRALELVRRIEQAKTHLHQLLEEVRNYAAPIVLDRSPVRISEAWREAWELLSEQRRNRQAQLCEHIVASNLVVEADRFRMVLVFRNLLDNALAAARDPVEIDIYCETTGVGSSAALRIRICDNGPGLSPEQQRRIFEPFYTTKPTGTGLGTAIAQRLVEAHGGTIVVGACHGQGTEIIVTLPCTGGGSRDMGRRSCD